MAPPCRFPSDGSGSFFCEGLGCTVEASEIFSQLWELMSFSCSSMQVFRERIRLMYGDFTTLNVLQLGIGMMQLLLSMPREAPADMRKKTTPTQRQRDLLPLPLSSVGAALKVIRLLRRSPNGFLIFEVEPFRKLPKQQRRTLLSKACSQVWRFNCTTVLNGQFLNWKGPLFYSWETHNPAQREARDNIERCCNYFSNDPLKELGPVDFKELVKQKGIDYSGEEVSHALPLRLGELLPGLPEREVAGTLNAAEVADEEVREWLEDPRQCLLPEEKWPSPLPTASMNVKKEEWPTIAATLVERNILTPIPFSEIACAGGVPVLNGLFAVVKKGKPAAGEARVTRLIMNLTPSNALQKLMQADLDTLAAASHWAGCQLPAGSALLWSGDDQKGAFYAWALPSKWRSYMAFKWPVPGWCVGRPMESEVWLASKVIPMGWINSVSLFQHLHRRIGLQQPPLGAGQDHRKEMRRDRPVPKSATEVGGGWVSFYLDDFDCPEIVPKSMAEQLKGTMSPTHARQREAYKRVGVAISSDKAHTRELRVERMGAEVDGQDGWLGTPLTKKLECGYFVLWALQQESCRQKVLLMILGRLVRAFEFRRPLMSLLNTSWPKTKAMVCRPLKMCAIKELLWSVSILPMAVVNLRAPVSGLVTVSDASEKGGGLCGSAGLTEEGREVLQRMTTRDQDREQVSFVPAGATGIELRKKGPRVLVISLFDGVGAMVVALSRLECQIVGYASCEVDRTCKRLTRTRWPGVIELGDITKVEAKTIQLLADSVGYKLDLVLIGAGSPCQDLSSLNAQRTGLAGEKSKLFFEVPRVVALVKQTFKVPVESFVENVASMSEDSTKEFSRVLGVTAILLDAKHFCDCRRPRFYWPSWDIVPQGEEEIKLKNAWLEWTFPAVTRSPSEWLEEGCSWTPSQKTWFPTFTRPQRRNVPPYKPAGLEYASAEAIDRWHQDSYFVQVYNYENDHMITTPDGTLRLPTLREKELIMGFDKGYISKSFGDKTCSREQELLGGQMIGNTFNVYAVMMLLHECLRKYGGQEVRDPKQLVSIQGSSPDGWVKYPRFVSKTHETTDVKDLVKFFLLQGEKGGCDVRLDLNVPFRIKAWPRSGIRSRLFHWSIVHGYSWQEKAHINGLELQAVINSIKWRLRKASRAGHRVLHLVDSQVVAAILAKGRSSSFRLQLGVSKYAALVVASGTVVAVAYVDTRENPADIPSRWAEDKAKRRKLQGKQSEPSTL